MRGRIKILYLIGTLDIGGAEGQLVALARGLDRTRFEPVVFCLTATGPLAAELEAAGIRVVGFGLRGLRLWRHPLRVLWAIGAVVIAVRRERPRIIQGVLFHAYVLAALAGRLAGVPHILASRRSLGAFKESRPHYRLAERWTNRLVHVWVANSEAVRHDVAAREGVDPARIRMVYNAIRTEGYGGPRSEALAAALGLPPGGPVVGVVANLIHYKGHTHLLAAGRRVAGRFPRLTFLLVGEGPCRAALERQAAGLGLAERVRFLGSRRDVPALLALMDVVALPSLEEGFPNALLEAMAAGKPVVASRVGGVPEAVVEGQTGLLVPPGDPAALAEALLALLEDPARAAAMGAAGRRHVAERFGMARMVEETQTVYEELLRGAGH